MQCKGFALNAPTSCFFQELSPNVDCEVELHFRTGDLLLVYGEMDDDGFFMGELNGKRGLVPSNFLTDVPPGYDPKHLMKLMAAAASVSSNGNGSNGMAVPIHR